MTTVAEAAEQLSAAQLRELIKHIVENVDDAADVALKFVEHSGPGPGVRRRSLSTNDLKQLELNSVVAESKTDVKGKINGHAFQSHSYFSPTFCEHCRKLLKGIIRQGQQCSRCFLNAHQRCVPYLDECEGRRISKASRRRRKKEQGVAAAASPQPPPRSQPKDGDDSSSSDSDDDDEVPLDLGPQRLVRATAQRTGAEADWTTHSASFRGRLQHTRPLDLAALHECLGHPEALMGDYRNIPENKVPVSAIPRFTEYKNRFMNILPNAHSRVLLSQLGDDATSTYINANWMRGFRGKPDAYVACQGPLRDTTEDFWRMAWECNSHVIAMITNLEEAGVTKCERYWPTAPGPDGMITCGPFTIVADGEPEMLAPQYFLTRLTLSRGKEQRTVHHFWWRDWPDKGVPATTTNVTSFVLAVRAASGKLTGPAIIHCSAGVGRTGCFLTVDLCLMQYEMDQRIDIVAAVCQLRQDRGCTVQTFDQYHFIHKVLFDHIAPSQPSMSPQHVSTRSTASKGHRLSVVLADAPEGDASTERLDGMQTPRPASPSDLVRKESARVAASIAAASSDGLEGSEASDGGGLLSVASQPRRGSFARSLAHPAVTDEPQPAPDAYLNIAEDSAAEANGSISPQPTSIAVTDDGGAGAAVVSATGAPATTTAAGTPVRLTASTNARMHSGSFLVPRSNSIGTPAAAAAAAATAAANGTTSGAGSTTPAARRAALVAAAGPDAVAPPPATTVRHNSPPVSSDVAHDFRSKTFVVDTPCCICGELLVGLCKQGLRCRPCGRSVHAHCLEQITDGCIVVTPSRTGRALPVWPPRRGSQKF